MPGPIKRFLERVNWHPIAKVAHSHGVSIFLLSVEMPNPLPLPKRLPRGEEGRLWRRFFMLVSPLWAVSPR